MSEELNDNLEDEQEEVITSISVLPTELEKTLSQALNMSVDIFCTNQHA